MAKQAGGGEARSAGRPRVTLLPADGFLAGICSHPATTVFGDHTAVPEKPEMWRSGPVGGNGKAMSADPARRPTREDHRSAGSWVSEPARRRLGQARKIRRRHAAARRASSTMPPHSLSR